MLISWSRNTTFSYFIAINSHYNFIPNTVPLQYHSYFSMCTFEWFAAAGETERCIVNWHISATIATICVLRNISLIAIISIAHICVERKGKKLYKIFSVTSYSLAIFLSFGRDLVPRPLNFDLWKCSFKDVKRIRETGIISSFVCAESLNAPSKCWRFAFVAGAQEFPGLVLHVAKHSRNVKYCNIINRSYLFNWNAFIGKNTILTAKSITLISRYLFWEVDHY